MLRRLAPLAALAVLAVGCGGKVVLPLPDTVIGTLPTTTVPKGSPSAGKAVFTTSGCAACHTFGPAGSAGKIGPSLDQLATYAKKANEPLEQFARSGILNPPPAYVPPGFKNVMPTTFGTSLTAKQVADLVAFLTQSS